MGFFKKSVPSEVKRTGLTIIAKGNKIAGEMVITGKLHIDGTVEGSITSIEDVSIGKTGVILGKLNAKNVTVNGLLEGEVECDHLHITAGGKVKANVCSIDLTMEAQSHFFGESREKIPQVNTINQAELTNIDSSISHLQHEKKGDNLLDDLPNAVTSYEQTAEIYVPHSSLKEQDVSEQVEEPSQQDDVAEQEKKSYEPKLSYSVANEDELNALSFNRIDNQEPIVAAAAEDTSSMLEENNKQDKVKVETEHGSEVKDDQNDSAQLTADEGDSAASDLKKSRKKTVDENTTVMELKI